MRNFNWQCPFCQRHTTIIEQRLSIDNHRISIDSKQGRQVLNTRAIACPNQDCKELFIVASLAPYESISGGGYRDGKVHTRWSLRPQASVRTFPEYVPAPILEDYREACLIKDLSPKASTTLARRCLQGIIRDFWKISRDRLIDEIKELEAHVDAKTWQAIDAVRKIGNVGAHMDKDINLIVDVDTNEASLLIALIESLIEDWYVERHERSRRMDEIIEVAKSKKPRPLDSPIDLQVEATTEEEIEPQGAG